MDVKWLIPASLRGFSQVMLIENALSGSLIFFGIFLYSPTLALIALLSSIVGTVTGSYYGKDKQSASQGIYGFNSLLSGIAVTLFLQSDWRWLIALFAALLATFVMIGVTQFLAKRNIPILTFPFVFVTWIGLLATYLINPVAINPTFVASSPVKWNLPMEHAPHFFLGLIKGVGEVFIIDSISAGSLILVALFVAGWRFGVYAIVGTFVSWLTALSFGVNTEMLDLGLYNYNAVLTMIAIGLAFDAERRFLLIGIFAAAMTVPITAGLDLLLSPIGLPILTFPFIISTWLFLAFIKVLPKVEVTP